MKPGDVVKLKSGSPAMTLAYLKNDGDDDEGFVVWRCEWFEDLGAGYGNVKEFDFYEHQLELVVAEDKGELPGKPALAKPPGHQEGSLGKPKH